MVQVMSVKETMTTFNYYTTMSVFLQAKKRKDCFYTGHSISVATKKRVRPPGHSFFRNLLRFLPAQKTEVEMDAIVCRRCLNLQFSRLDSRSGASAQGAQKEPPPV